jgi:hypothetical protein
MTDHRATRVAARAIRLAILEGAFTAAAATRGLEDAPSDATVRRVLRQLEADGWLQRSSKESPIWRAGREARMLGDMSTSARDRADRTPIGPGTDALDDVGPL